MAVGSLRLCWGLGCMAYFSGLVRCYANEVRKTGPYFYSRQSIHYYLEKVFCFFVFSTALKLHYCSPLNEVTGDRGE